MTRSGRGWLRCLTLALVAVAVASLGVRAPSWAAEGENAEVQTAPVMLDGEELFVVRGAEAFSAEDRADRIADHIAEVAADDSIPVDAIVARPTDIGTGVFAGDVQIFTLIEADAEVVDISLAVLSEAVEQRVQSAIGRYRADRTPQQLMIWSGEALLAVLAFAAFVIGIGRLARYLRRLIERHAEMVGRAVERKSFAVLRSESLTSYALGGVSLLRWIVLLIGAYVCLNFILVLFPWTRRFADFAFRLFIAPIEAIFLGILGYLPNLMFLVIIVLIARFVLRAMRVIFLAVEHRRVVIEGFDPDWGMPTFRIARVLVIAFAIVMAYPYIPGSGSAALQGMSIFLGVILSLGSSSIIANIIAGYSMNYRRTFRVGDVVKVGANVGQVTEVRLLVTHLRTPKNESIAVPNSVILNSEVTNYSTMARDPGVIIGAKVGIGYEVPWRQVEGMLLIAADRTAGALKEPRPFVLECGLGDFAVSYEINVYTDISVPIPILLADLQRNVLDVFNEYGVAIMTPAYVADPEEAKVVPPENWFAAPARPGAAPDALASVSGAAPNGR